MADFNNLGSGGAALDGTYVGVIETVRGCWLPGTADNYLSAAPDPTQDITGDLEIEFRCSAPVWDTAAVANAVVSKSFAAYDVANQFGEMILAVNGAPVGVATIADLELADGVASWFRVTRIADTGVVQWFTAPAEQSGEPATWIERPTSGAMTPGPIATAPTQPLAVGVRPDTGDANFLGQIHNVIVRDGLGGLDVMHIADTDYPSNIGSASFPVTAGPDIDVSRSATGSVTALAATGTVTNPDENNAANLIQAATSDLWNVADTDDAVAVFVGSLGPRPISQAFTIGSSVTSGKLEIQNRTNGLLRARATDGVNAQSIASTTPTTGRDDHIAVWATLDRTAGEIRLDVYDADGVNVGSATSLNNSVAALIPGAGYEWLKLAPTSLTASLWNTGPDVLDGLDKPGLSRYLISGEPDASYGNELTGWLGAWFAGLNRIPGSDWPFAGCEVADGYGVLVEIFYNPDESARRFGEGTFGSDLFGQFDGPPPTAKRWVDITRSSFGTEAFRGQADPTIDQPTDELLFSILDPDGEIFAWRPPDQLGSPNINDPARVSIVGSDGVPTPVTYVRCNSFKELLGADTRQIDVVGYGLKTDTLVGIINPQRPKESVADRIDFAFSQISFQDGIAPYPPIFDTHDLSADTHDRSVAESLAYQMIQEAANSANHYMHTDDDGSIIWREIANLEPPDPPIWVIGDCFGVGENVVATTIQYAADTTEILNRVQLVNAMKPAENVEANDLVSQSKWGVRSRGFGFPLRVVNDQQTDAQAIADAYLEMSASIINRVRQVEFDTLVDPRWWSFLLDLDISLDTIVRRTEPNGVEDFTADLIGLDVRFNHYGISGVIFLSTTTQTF